MALLLSTNLEGTSLKKANLSGATLSGVTFDNTCFDGADLSETVFLVDDDQWAGASFEDAFHEKGGEPVYFNERIPLRVVDSSEQASAQD
jgi:hypothetical protein